jgi:hypothetical protein
VLVEHRASVASERASRIQHVVRNPQAEGFCVVRFPHYRESRAGLSNFLSLRRISHALAPPPSEWSEGGAMLVVFGQTISSVQDSLDVFERLGDRIRGTYRAHY